MENTASDISVRPLDPNVLQRRASDPDSNVWVNASAGSGKTKVLTDRVLRLLLPRADGSIGTDIHKILCITFTKAGASEMALRIQDILSEWSIIPENELRQKLEKLLGIPPNTEQIKKARQLFNDVLDAPEAMKIMTIHSFCQSILGRFPLEAGLNPHFQVMDETEAAAISKDVQTKAIKNLNDQNHPLYSEFQVILEYFSSEQFSAISGEILKERYQLLKLEERTHSFSSLYNELCAALNIQPGDNKKDIVFTAIKNINHEKIRTAMHILMQGGKKDKDKAAIFDSFLSLQTQEQYTQEAFNIYSSAFLKASGDDLEIYASLASKKLQEQYPDETEYLYAEAQRILDTHDKLRSINTANLTHAIIRTGHYILSAYEDHKRQSGRLDFDDLILRVLDLLDQKNMNSWVMFKLDQGIDHILVDEAQDTNPEQWKIIARLCDDFFDGNARDDNITRTVFVVGDEKQSIYSFQRAAPEEFQKMKEFFKQKAIHSNGVWAPVNMDISFRSSQSVLKIVDDCFAEPNIAKGVSQDNIAHTSFRRGQEGQAVLWPIFSDNKTDDDNLSESFPLPLPDKIVQQPSGVVQLSEFIARQIKNWLENEEILPSRGRPIKPADIMILTPSRKAISKQITKELRKLNIPVTGTDRMVLAEEQAVCDMMNLIHFCLQPDDDYMLACTLKSPIIGLDDDDLLKLCPDRKSTLWDALQGSTLYQDISSYLRTCIETSEKTRPYRFIHELLDSPCPADKTSLRRAIQKRLGHDIKEILDVFCSQIHHFENTYTPSLQNFAIWMKTNNTNVKKEQDENIGQIKLMTVHGSKGLQAPIVILPDTLRVSKSGGNKIDKRLLWPQKTGLAVPLFSPSKKYDPLIYKKHFNILEEKADEEYRRLLYVAMTRAEDRLYIAGATGGKTPIPESWYYMIANAFKRSEYCITQDQDGQEIHVISNPQTKEADKTETQEKIAPPTLDLPDWISRPAPQEPEPPLVIRPSDSDMPETPAFDPSLLFTPASMTSTSNNGEATQNISPIRRGIIIHKLLEFLPDIKAENRRNAAYKFLSHHKDALKKDEAEHLANTLCGLMEAPEFAGFFDQKGRNEVPVCGMINGQIINGQIDRLVINNAENKIWILDYKTGKPAQDYILPPAYKKQMTLYRELVTAIYPNYEIQCAILWTDAPSLSIIP